MSSTTVRTGEREVVILADLLGNGNGKLSDQIARYILEIGFTDEQRSRMHDLAARNQRDALSTEEKEELLAFGKAGDILAILKSKARRTLGVKPTQRVVS